MSEAAVLGLAERLVGEFPVLQPDLVIEAAVRCVGGGGMKLNKIETALLSWCFFFVY